MKGLCVFLSLVLGIGSMPNGAAAQHSTHLVSEAELKQALSALPVERERNLAEIRALLANEKVRSQVGAFADLAQIEEAVANLDDETLRDLGERSRRANQNLSAAASRTTWITVGVAAAVGVVVAVLLYIRFVENE